MSVMSAFELAIPYVCIGFWAFEKTVKLTGFICLLKKLVSKRKIYEIIDIIKKR